jgi:glycerophosphoryl diester phosphodiesterase
LKRFATGNPILIAHRGASGYLPEHTLEAKALAMGLGADFVEQDVVLTRDDVPIVTHDVHIEDVTDVAQRFPGRGRADGHFYAIDFTLAELKTLARHERVADADHPVFHGRFPRTSVRFAVITLQEEIEFVQGYNRSSGRNIGLYTEIKHPAWHRQQGKDITRIVLDLLAAYGYRHRADNVYLQCFDSLELKRARQEFHSELKFVQLIGENAWKESSTDYDAMRTAAGMKDVAAYAQGIGPEIGHIAVWRPDGGVRLSELTRWAHDNGMAVHPYTHRVDALPEHAPDSDAVLSALFDQAGVDGVFTDFTDVVVRWLEARAKRGSSGVQRGSDFSGR